MAEIKQKGQYTQYTQELEKAEKGRTVFLTHSC